ncbi:MAG: lactate utilization protein C [Peptococcaceae bacterium]|nr:lactate utilization protein C [Peptococcaceae bacterium]
MLNEQHKQAFLHNVSLALGRNEVPKSVEPYDFTKGPQHHVMSEVQTDDEILARFKVECDKLAIQYTEVDPSGLKDAVIKVLEDYGGGKVICPDVPQMEKYGLNEAFAELEGKDGLHFVKWEPARGREYNIDNAQDANIGITFPWMAIAETATVLQESVAGSGRSVGLLPITHVAIVHRSTIKRRMGDTMVALRKQFQDDPANFPSAVVHISGPSSTADIELVRVVGVHGPVNVTYIIVND